MIVGGTITKRFVVPEGSPTINATIAAAIASPSTNALARIIARQRAS